MKATKTTFDVVDRRTGKVIARNFKDFCKCGMLTDKTHPLHVKNSEKDFAFYVNNEKINP